MVRDVLAIVEDGERGAAFLKAAADLAAGRGAFLEVAALTPAPMAAPALAPLGALYIPEAVLIGDAAANVQKVRDILGAAGCEHDVTGFHNDAAWLAGEVSRSRQIADLIVIGTDDGWTIPWLRTRLIETMIRSAGTPVLILPTGQTLRPVRRAVLGWKPSPEATRAIHHLVRLAEPGALIDVVTVGVTPEDCGKETDTHAGVKRHLARHGFDAQGRWIVNDEQIEAETLTLCAQEVDADLLVVGGFAHSRIRDIIMGGVTRDLVRRTDLPVLIVG